MDSIILLEKLSDNYIDLILTDPPYGINENNEKNLSRGCMTKPTDYGHYEWDKERICKKYFDEMLRVSKNQIIFGGNYYTDYLKTSSCWIVWDKDNGNSDFADCELAWGSFNSAVRKFKWKWMGLYQERMKYKEKRYHPTQKPLPLFRWIIEKYSDEDDIILDPFIGCGTTAVACKQLNRKFIGIDINKEYVDITNKRLKNIPNRLESFIT